jgi:ribosomal protein S18 acetylase RimI-like enzyme
MDRKILIRPAQDDDYPVIAALLKTLALAFITPGMAPEAASTFLRENDADALRVYRTRGHVVSVAEIGGRIAGFIAIRPPSHLFHLFVAQDFHRCGVGRRLWDSARGDASSFTVNSSPFAVPVYESLGFTCSAPLACVRGVSFQPMVYQRDM